jgi:hypothetical protein
MDCLSNGLLGQWHWRMSRRALNSSHNFANTITSRSPYSGAEVARSELEECRIPYLEVVNQTLVDYRRRVREIAEIAGVASEVDIPKLVNDDRLLDEARIGVCFGFDNKDPVPLGDPPFSGGQQVIAGLILLMAMAEIESHGFFMLDEPFAHLSLDRIDHVGGFCEAHARNSSSPPRPRLTVRSSIPQPSLSCYRKSAPKNDMLPLRSSSRPGYERSSPARLPIQAPAGVVGLAQRTWSS